MVGFPLLLVPLALYNIIVFLMSGVSLTDALFKVPMMAGREWPVTLSDILLTLGIVLLLIEIIKCAQPGGRRFMDHLLSLIVFGVAAAEFVMWEKFGTSTYFLLTLLAMTDFLGGIAHRRRRRRYVMTEAAPVSPNPAPSEMRRQEPEVDPAPPPASQAASVPAPPPPNLQRRAPDPISPAAGQAEKPAVKPRLDLGPAPRRPPPASQVTPPPPVNWSSAADPTSPRARQAEEPVVKPRLDAGLVSRPSPASQAAAPVAAPLVAPPPASAQSVAESVLVDQPATEPAQTPVTSSSDPAPHLQRSELDPIWLGARQAEELVAKPKLDSGLAQPQPSSASQAAAPVVASPVAESPSSAQSVAESVLVDQSATEPAQKPVTLTTDNPVQQPSATGPTSPEAPSR